MTFAKIISVGTLMVFLKKRNRKNNFGLGCSPFLGGESVFIDPLFIIAFIVYGFLYFCLLVGI